MGISKQMLFEEMQEDSEGEEFMSMTDEEREFLDYESKKILFGNPAYKSLNPSKISGYAN